MWMWTLNFLRNETRNLINEYFKILLKNNLYASVHVFNCLTIRNIYFIKSHMYYLNPIYWVFFIFYSFQIYFLIFFSLLFRFEHNQPQESHFFLYCACCIFCFWYDSLFIFILFFGLIFFGLIFGTNYSNNDNAKGQDGVEE